MDVDGQYRGIDHQIHKAEGFVNYSVFSLWDTYRALHPLLTIIQPERTSDMINSMLAHYDQSVHKLLPVWSHFGNENWCMIGYMPYRHCRRLDQTASAVLTRTGHWPASVSSAAIPIWQPR